MAGFSPRCTVTELDEFLCCYCLHNGSGLAVTTVGDESYHLHCFSLPEWYRLDWSIVSVEVEDATDRKTVAQWIQRHNSQFSLPQIGDIAQYRKRLETQRTDTPRSLLEAMKFLDPMELALTVGAVSAVWYHAVWNEELWVGFRHCGISGKLAFIHAMKTRCFRCNCDVDSVEKIGIALPRTRRPLCIPCRNSKEMRLISVASFCKLHNISPKHSPHFLPASLRINNTNYAFLELALKTLISLRQSWRSSLEQWVDRLQIADKPQALAVLHAVDVSQEFDRRVLKSHPYADLIRAVLTLTPARKPRARVTNSVSP